MAQPHPRAQGSVVPPAGAPLSSPRCALHAFARSVCAAGHAAQVTICIDPFHAVKLVTDAALQRLRITSVNECVKAATAAEPVGSAAVVILVLPA